MSEIHDESEIKMSEPILGLDELSVDEKVALENREIILTDNFDNKFAVKRSYLVLSKVIDELISDDCTTFHLPELSDNMLEYFVKYFNYHKGNNVGKLSQPLKSKNLVDACKHKWDADFINNMYDKHGVSFMRKFIEKADFFVIFPLLYLACAKIASLIMGQDCSDIEKILTESCSSSLG